MNYPPPAVKTGLVQMTQPGDQKTDAEVPLPPEFVTPQDGSEKQDCIGGQIYRQTTGPTPHFP